MKKVSYHSFFLLLTLYLAQGLPIGFMTQALPAILREYNVSLKSIGWTGILLAPWALKFLWAPFVDRFYCTKIGQSKSWILPLQLLSVITLILIMGINPADLTNNRELTILFVLLFTMNLFGATHDIASDAFTTRSLDRNDYSTGSSVQVIGYRLGLIVGGGVFLIVLDVLGWKSGFLGLALLVLLNTIPILLHKEPNWQENKRAQSKKLEEKPWLIEQFGYFWQSTEMRFWFLVLVTFKICDGLSSGMVKPMMTDMGISLQQIGLWGSIVGSVASLLGAALAAFLMRHLSRFQALFYFNLLQVLTTAGYALVAFGFEQRTWVNVPLIFAFNALEHAMAAMALVAMLSSVMAYARTESAGSDFTFQVCMLAFFSGNAHIVSGYIADSYGYTFLFCSSIIVGVLCLYPLFLWKKHQSTQAV